MASVSVRATTGGLVTATAAFAMTMVETDGFSSYGDQRWVVLGIRWTFCVMFGCLLLATPSSSFGRFGQAWGLLIVGLCAVAPPYYVVAFVVIVAAPSLGVATIVGLALALVRGHRQAQRDASCADSYAGDVRTAKGLDRS